MPVMSSLRSANLFCYSNGGHLNSFVHPLYSTNHITCTLATMSETALMASNDSEAVIKRF